MLLQCIFGFLGVDLDDELFLALNIVQQLAFIFVMKIFLDYHLIEALNCIG